MLMIAGQPSFSSDDEASVRHHRVLPPKNGLSESQFALDARRSSSIFSELTQRSLSRLSQLTESVNIEPPQQLSRWSKLREKYGLEPVTMNKYVIRMGVAVKAMATVIQAWQSTDCDIRPLVERFGTVLMLAW